MLTDFGIVGLRVALRACSPVRSGQLWREGRLDVPAMIFCALFLMSFYQRPIIWLPAQLLIYFAGLTFRRNHRSHDIRRQAHPRHRRHRLDGQDASCAACSAGELGTPQKVIVFSRDEAKQHEMRLALPAPRGRPPTR